MRKGEIYYTMVEDQKAVDVEVFQGESRSCKVELEKMFGSGRYWEWLEALEKEGLIRDHRKEWVEAWQILVRRSFRGPIHDEAYRFLTSLAFRIEKLLSPQATHIDRNAFSFIRSPPISSLENSLAEIEKEIKMVFLWKPLQTQNPKQ